ncbi:MAG: hypothetical protein HC882_03715 [Acidobacteria bacterium]|nr:hypothetical protein [Acidobacteriota bacterium]
MHRLRLARTARRSGLVLQPQVDLRYRGFSGQVWANVTIDAKASEMTDVDLLLTWTAHTGSVSWTVTAIEYEFPTGAPGTREIAVSAALPGSWGAPRVSVFRDLDQTDGTYATLSLSKALATWHRSRLTGDISVSWGDRKNNFGNFGLRESGGNDGFVAVTLTHAVSERVSISALVRAWEIIDGGLARSARSIFGKDDGIVAAATVTLGF